MTRSFFSLSKVVFLFGLILGGMFLGGLLHPLEDAPMGDDLLHPPSGAHLLGTNDLGQDLLLRTLLATPNTVIIGFGAGVITMIVSTLYAFFTTVASPGVQRVMMRLVDAQLALPTLVIAMLIASYIRPGVGTVVAILVVLGWPSEVREMCSVILREVSRDSYRLAQNFGGSRLYLLRHHVLPRVAPLWIAMTIQNIHRGVLHSAGLAFLGILDPSLPTWGGMISEAIPLLYTPQALWLIGGPVGALTLLLLFLTFGGMVMEKVWSQS